MKEKFLRKFLKSEFQHELSNFGGIWFYGLVALAFLVLAKWEPFLEIVIGFFAIFAVMFLIRSFYFKERPQKLKHDSYLSKINASSFPSIHAMRSTVLATILFIHFGIWQLIIPLALIPIFACYSRIAIKRHDLVDITFGVIFGIIVGWLITFLQI